MEYHKMIVNILIVITIILNTCDSMYTNEWAVHITGGVEKAKELAGKYNFIYEGEIIEDIYQFRHKDVVKRSARPHSTEQTLGEEPSVKWLEQQYVKVRLHRNAPNDPNWSKMWYVNRGGGKDMNVQQAWNMGYTGDGSVVTVLSDGIEKDHPDLMKNYDKDASYDINDNDPDPQPRLEIFNYNTGGTRGSGVIAAVANNSLCTVGIAYDAKIGGIRMLDGDVTDSVEGRSIGYNQQHIDIYNAPWGPENDGRNVDGPGFIAKHAFKLGAEKGRGGKGNIFVWAAGNGGPYGDSCSCDGYITSIYTIAVSGVTERQTVPWYNEPCPAILVSAYSSGSGNDRMIISTDLRHECTEQHTGTSASSNIASGIIALALQANPTLTWRDVQHVIIHSSNPKHLLTGDWITNGVGLKFSHFFGFGLMDASAMVQLARRWTNVPSSAICDRVGSSMPVTIFRNITRIVKFERCLETDKEINFLEHVQVKLSLSAGKRGGVSIYLTSPSGTKSTLLGRRAWDYGSDGFNNWEFLSLISWGESPVGEWTLQVFTESKVTVLRHWSLILHGTKSLPIDNHQMPEDKEPHESNQNVNSWSGYNRKCDSSHLRCPENMRCIPESRVCKCIPGLVFNKDRMNCEQRHQTVSQKDESPTYKLHTTTVYANNVTRVASERPVSNAIIIGVSGMFAFLFVLGLLLIAIYKWKKIHNSSDMVKDEKKLKILETMF